MDIEIYVLLDEILSPQISLIELLLEMVLCLRLIRFQLIFHAHSILAPVHLPKLYQQKQSLMLLYHQCFQLGVRTHSFLTGHWPSIGFASALIFDKIYSEKNFNLSYSFKHLF